MQEKVFQRAADQRVDLRRNLGIPQFFLGLPLELRLLEVEAENRDDTLARVFCSNRQPFGGEVVHTNIVTHRLDDRRLQVIEVLLPVALCARARSASDAIPVGGLVPSPRAT